MEPVYGPSSTWHQGELYAVDLNSFAWADAKPDAHLLTGVHDGCTHGWRLYCAVASALASMPMSFSSNNAQRQAMLRVGVKAHSNAFRVPLAPLVIPSGTSTFTASSTGASTFSSTVQGGPPACRESVAFASSSISCWMPLSAVCCTRLSVAVRTYNVPVMLSRNSLLCAWTAWFL